LSQDLLKTRYRQLLGYIAELDRLRTSTVRTVTGHPDALDLLTLSAHPSVVWDPRNQSAILVVTRCETPQSPPLPESLVGWVYYTPNQIQAEPFRSTSIFRGGQEVNWEDSGLSEEWDQWLSSWTAWAEESRPAFEARALYATLYDLHATIERNSEQLELVAVDVMVARGTVDHPILINPAHLKFDAERSQFTLSCLEEPSQVYGDAIREELPEAGNSIASARKEVAENPDIWAFGGEEVDRFATRFVQGADPDGEFIDGPRQSDKLMAYRHPWLLLRKRATGLAELAEGLISKFDEDGLVPDPIQPVLVDREDREEKESDYRGEPDEDENSYFTKPANAEQLAILRNYRRRRCVHVQGPPGTGKTHTIANLIGHFLAEGKSVLVTSEKAQALSVLREKVVEDLQPLCVSMVGSDACEGLKASMRGLFEKLSGTEPSRLASDIERLKTARTRTIEELRRARQTMREIIEKEHLPIEVPGWRGSPASAGRYVNERRSTDGWIPRDVCPEFEPPLSQFEFEELLDLLAHYTGDVVPEVRKPIPPVDEVPTPDELEELVEEIVAVSGQVLPQPAVNVPQLIFEGGPTEAELLLLELQEALSRLKALDASYRELANQTVETPAFFTDWESWIKRAGEILGKEQQVSTDAAPYEFTLAVELDSVLSSAKQLLEHVRKTGRPAHKPRFLNRSDKVLFESVSSKRRIGDAQSLNALVQHLEFEDERDRFRRQVYSSAQRLGLTDFGNGEPERILVRDPSLRTALDWKSQEFDPIDARAAAVGLGFDRAERFIPPNLARGGPVDRRAWWWEEVVALALKQALHANKLNVLRARKKELLDRAGAWKNGDPSQTLRALADALLAENLPDYRQAFTELQGLRAAAEPVQRRDALLERIRARAERFAASLEDSSFESGRIQGTLDSAWTFALIDQELMRRHALSLEEAKNELDRLKKQLDGTTVKLADALAWAAQHRRVTQPVRSALSRFHEAQRKIGRGTGRRAPEFQNAMRNAMREAKDAFPVWIMPLYDVAKSFDFTKTRFDVVIVDESSQLSVVGLITLLIADSAIVVGDDEQTEPSLVGVSFDSVKSLIQEHLVDFTDRILWSPDSSLYSFAGRFGSTVALREHFRCVPQIISFSSRLCYQGKIQALRESRGVVQLPHVVPIPCDRTSHSTSSDVNEAEASKIASLLLACWEQPEYQDQTFGVISLRGSADSRGADPQTSRVLELLQTALGAADYERLAARLRLKFGVPPAFQGDERDVVFISVGDASTLNVDRRSGPMKLLSGDTLPGGQYKKRLNVAVSRARNQVWVVHSFSHFEAELKEGDVRRELLEFAYAPDQWLESTQAVNPQAESPFEEAVYADLVRLGYKVTAQVPVGHYRIDLVAEDDDARVAIECDGDAYHQDAAADLSRQIVLERCGWNFIRVRGSEYYRHPEGAINRIIRELERLGVTPTHAQPDQKEPDGELLRKVRNRASEIQREIEAGHSIELRGLSPVQVVVGAPNMSLQEPGDYELSEQDFDLGFDEDEESPIQALSGDNPPVADSESTQGERTSQVIRGCSIAVEDYIQFKETGHADPKGIWTDEIQKSLVRIVRVEGPATEATVIDRYRVATGYGRFKGPTRDRVVSALNKAVKSGLLSAKRDYPESDVMVYYLPGEPEVRFRTRGPRDLHDVPMGEIVTLASELLRANVASDDEELFRLMLEFYGLKRLTAQAEARLRKARELGCHELR
jgi:very-short-patch-repair endonuclease